MITAVGKQFIDWSAYYRIFSHLRIDTDKFFEIIFLMCINLLEDQPFIVAHMDDTIIHKKGKKVAGTSWRRDPLGPPFHTNFIWGQRYIQTSVAVPMNSFIGRSRAIPIGFRHCPTAKKPSKNATQKQIQNYKEEQKQLKLNKQGAIMIAHTRQILDNNGFSDKKLVFSVDGSYTNGTVLKSLPENVSLIGRIRKDAKFHRLPSDQPATGRKRTYGEDLPTPEQIRQSDAFPWIKVTAWAAGKLHDFDVKVVNNIMWRKAGAKLKLKLIVIRPLAYRLTKKSRVLYRQPAYLICTDEELTIQQILQSYLWRWEIEVNIGEEKSLFGVGKSHVRTLNSVESLPAFVTAIYSLLHLAEIKTKKENSISIPRPKWYPAKESKRVTTGDLIINFRTQIYCRAVGLSFSHFVNNNLKTKHSKNAFKSTNINNLFCRA